MNTTDQKKVITLAEKLAFSPGETCEMLGGISAVTLWRYVKRGLIAPVAGTNGRLYSKKSVMAFLEKSETAA